MLPRQSVGGIFGKWALSNDVRGKIVQEEIDASKEKGSKKEEALSERERSRCKGLERPLEERESREVFYFRLSNSCRARRIVLETL
jgi:hypothetical protein